MLSSRESLIRNYIFMFYSLKRWLRRIFFAGRPRPYRLCRCRAPRRLQLLSTVFPACRRRRPRPQLSSSKRRPLPLGARRPPVLWRIPYRPPSIGQNQAHHPEGRDPEPSLPIIRRRSWPRHLISLRTSRSRLRRTSWQNRGCWIRVSPTRHPGRSVPPGRRRLRWWLCWRILWILQRWLLQRWLFQRRTRLNLLQCPIIQLHHYRSPVRFLRRPLHLVLLRRSSPLNETKH